MYEATGFFLLQFYHMISYSYTKHPMCPKIILLYLLKNQSKRGKGVGGGFRISSRGWQRYLQGVAKISQGVAKKNQRHLLPLSVFLLSYTLYYYFTPTFLTFQILVIKKYIKYIYFYSFSCSSFIFYTQVWFPSTF